MQNYQNYFAKDYVDFDTYKTGTAAEMLRVSSEANPESADPIPFCLVPSADSWFNPVLLQQNNDGIILPVIPCTGLPLLSLSKRIRNGFVTDFLKNIAFILFGCYTEINIMDEKVQK